MLSGMFIFSREVAPLKALSPIFVIVDGKATFVILFLPLKALSAISVTGLFPFYAGISTIAEL